MPICAKNYLRNSLRSGYERSSIDVVADIQFFPTEAGGRHTPITADSYSCIFEVDGEFLIVVSIWLTSDLFLPVTVPEFR